MKIFVLLAMCALCSASDKVAKQESPPDTGTAEATVHSVDGPRLSGQGSQDVVERPVFREEIDPPSLPDDIDPPSRPEAFDPDPPLPDPRPTTTRRIPRPTEPAVLTPPPGPPPTENNSGFWGGFSSAFVIGIIAVLASCLLWDMHFKRQRQVWESDRNEWRDEALRRRTENESLRDTIIRKIDHVFNTGDAFNVEMEVSNDGAKAKCGKREVESFVVERE